MTIKYIESLVGKTCAGIKEFTDVAVIGLSGGIDSTVVATLCRLALGAENVYGISMPYNKQDKETFNSRSAKLAAKLGINHALVPVLEIANGIGQAIWVAESAFATQGDVLLGARTKGPSQLNEGNARSRARMTVLYGVCSHLNETLEGRRARVIGTGNLSEDFIGYDTKGGDALADVFPIGELFKSEVYQLADYFVSVGLIDESLIDRVPSAGLWDGQTDESELGYTYNAMEPKIKSILAGNPDLDDEVTQFVIRRHNANKHKHMAPPVIPVREFCE